MENTRTADITMGTKELAAIMVTSGIEALHIGTDMVSRAFVYILFCICGMILYHGLINPTIPTTEPRDEYR